LVFLKRIRLKKMRAILVGLWKKGETKSDIKESMDELEGLVKALNGKALGKLIQKRAYPDIATYIGKGRLKDLKTLIEGVKADTVVFDDPLTPSQIREIEKFLKVKILDRTDLILEIFGKRARTRTAQLQVELARLEHLLPRLYGKGKQLSRLTGGIGGRGPGEQISEIHRRRIKQRIYKIKKELEEIRKRRREQRKRRIKEITSENNLIRVALVGYTNTGKSTLMRAITGRDVFAKNMLFATLDTTTSARFVYPDYKILITDTIGFIKKLPPEVLYAFKATLEEITEADIILHIVDVSNPHWLEKLETVNQILSQISVEEKPQIIVFNKIDKIIDSPEKIGELEFHMYISKTPYIYISAEKKWNIESLLEKIISVFKPS